MEIQLCPVTGFVVLPQEVSSSVETCPSQRALSLGWFLLLHVSMIENFSFISFYVEVLLFPVDCKELSIQRHSV